MSNNKWSKVGNVYTLTSITAQQEKLEKGIYKLGLDKFENPLLEKIEEKFHFPYKVYGSETAFINRVKRTWKHTSGNMGILLNGVKGTGKTVTAELICNDMEMPVIIVPFEYKGLTSFLNDIPHDVIVMIDEYEKIFSEKEHTLLTVMDGVLKTTNRVMFLLTTNALRIEQNMLQRPSRIRYLKTFGDLNYETIVEIIDDLLINTAHKASLLKVISEMSIVTIDLVKSIVQEVNIHDEDPELFKEYFNMHADTVKKHDVFELHPNGDKKLLYKKQDVLPDFFTRFDEGSIFYCGYDMKGTIQKVLNNNTIEVATTVYNDLTNKTEQVIKTIMIEKPKVTHFAFAQASENTFPTPVNIGTVIADNDFLLQAALNRAIEGIQN